MLHPDVAALIRNKQLKQQAYHGHVTGNFQIGDKVWAKDYTSGDSWVEGTIFQLITTLQSITKLGIVMLINYVQRPPLKCLWPHATNLKKINLANMLRLHCQLPPMFLLRKHVPPKALQRHQLPLPLRLLRNQMKPLQLLLSRPTLPLLVRKRKLKIHHQNHAEIHQGTEKLQSD